MRHNHLTLLQHLLHDKGVSLETKWTGLTVLHTEGCSGILKESPNRLPKLTDEMTILAEVLLQCNQDKFYSLEYAENILCLFLPHDENSDRRHLYVNSARSMTILHVMAVLPRPDPNQIFLFTVSHLTANEINIVDSNGDTPLHYASISYQTRNVRALLDLGWDPPAEYSSSLTPVNLSMLISIVLGPPICGFQKTATGSTSPSEEHERIVENLWESKSMSMGRSGGWGKYRHRQTVRVYGLRRTIAVFEERGMQVRHPLKHLAMAWGSLGERGEDRFHQLVPMKVVSGEQTRETGTDGAGLDSEANVAGPGPGGVVHTEEEFIIHQADWAEFKISDHH